MATYLRRRFQFLIPGVVHTFKIKAWAGLASSEWSDPYDLRTSEYDPIRWVRVGDPSDWLSAHPQFWARFIKVTWLPIVGFPLRFDHYILMRKPSTMSGTATAGSTNRRLVSTGSIFHASMVGCSIVNTTVGSGGLITAFVDENTIDTILYGGTRRTWINGDAFSIVLGNPTNAELEHADDTNFYYLADTGRRCFYLDFDITPGVTYNYWVRGIDKKGMPSSNYAGYNNAAWGVPETPEITGCTTKISDIFPGICDVELSFTCSGGAEYYIVQRKLNSMPESAWGWFARHEHDASLGDNQKVVVSNFLTDTTYNFRVMAVNAMGVLKSEWSDSYSYTTLHDTNPPGIPTSISADIPKRQNYVHLSWHMPDSWLRDEIREYEVYRKIDGNPQDTGTGYVKIATVGNVLFYKDDLATGTHKNDYEDHEYHYRIKTVDKYGYSSGFSNYDTASFQPPPAVALSTATVNYETTFNFWSIVTTNTVKFEWSRVDEADWYIVQWRWRRKHLGGSYATTQTAWSFPIRVDEDREENGRAHALANVMGMGKIEFRITAYNYHGGASSTRSTADYAHIGPTGTTSSDEDVIGIDKTAPDQIASISVEVNEVLWGAWNRIELSWDTPHWTEGVKCYHVRKRRSTEAGLSDYLTVVPNRYGDKTRFIDWYPARGDANATYVSYSIRPIDYMNNPGMAMQLAVYRPT